MSTSTVLASVLCADDFRREYRVEWLEGVWCAVYDRPEKGEVGNVHREGYESRAEALVAVAEIYAQFPPHVVRLGISNSVVQAEYDRLVSERQVEIERKATAEREQQEREEQNQRAKAELLGSVPKKGFKRGTVTLATEEGTTGETVSGTVVGPFLVHKIDSRGYTVVHCKTGLGTGVRGVSRELAIGAAGLFSLRGNWDFGPGEKPDAETLQHGQRVKKAVMADRWWLELQESLLVEASRYNYTFSC